MTSKCEHLAELLKIQEDIIRKNLDTHKWLRHIADKEQGMIDFVEAYGWLMRQIHCGYICEKRFDCIIAKEYIKEA